jgi:uncharacterized protein (DUF885 family)
MIVNDAKASLFYRPIEQLPASFSAADQERLTRAYVNAIEQILVPSYRRMVEFLRKDYLSQTRKSFAWSELPNGKAWYDYLVRNQTTTELTPDEIFALGEKEIQRIKLEMERLRRASGFQGTLIEYARDLSDKAPRGYSSRPDLIKGYEEIRARSRPISTIFSAGFPSPPFEVRTIEVYREQSAPSQYWSATPDGSRPGIFYVNARGIETNPRRVSEPLFLTKRSRDITSRSPSSASSAACRVSNDLPITPRLPKAGRFTLKALAPNLDCIVTQASASAV